MIEIVKTQLEEIVKIEGEIIDLSKEFPEESRIWLQVDLVNISLSELLYEFRQLIRLMEKGEN